ncbi:placenta-specific protein 9-like [Heterodontus francisci]|uniref:placenta-specific protein 9-like n=1 Tax=Heterodontus francisci TaxID=7792 RepID=UPI00355B770F
MQGVWVLAGILLLLGPTATGLEPQRNDTNWCERDKALHKRLDVVEKNIERTVDHLEAEVSALLRFIEASNPPLQLGAPTIDIFESGLY